MQLLAFLLLSIQRSLSVFSHSPKSVIFSGEIFNWGACATSHLWFQYILPQALSHSISLGSGGFSWLATTPSGFAITFISGGETVKSDFGQVNGLDVGLRLMRGFSLTVHLSSNGAFSSFKISWVEGRWVKGGSYKVACLLCMIYREWPQAFALHSFLHPYNPQSSRSFIRNSTSHGLLHKRISTKLYSLSPSK